jgi:hypothetical protein
MPPPAGLHPGLAAAAVLAGACSMAAIAEWAADAPRWCAPRWLLLMRSGHRIASVGGPGRLRSGA